MQKLETRPALHADIDALYGGPAPHTVRAWVACENGEPIAIAGIYYCAWSGRPILFSRLTDAMRKHKRAIVHYARRLAMIAKSCGAVAVPSCDEALAPKLLRRIGMVPIGQCSEGEIYGWTSD